MKYTIKERLKIAKEHVDEGMPSNNKYDDIIIKNLKHSNEQSITRCDRLPSKSNIPLFCF